MPALQDLVDRLAADGRVTAEEALQLRQAVFPDGVVSRDEAEALIALDARVASQDAAWAAAFVEGVVDYAMRDGGHVSAETADWLIAAFGHEGARETEVEAVLKVLERAESAPESLCAFARMRLAALVADRPMGAAETALVRRCLYAGSGSGATAVTEAEARWLFALDAQTDGRANDPAWGDLFVKGVLNHLMGKRAPALLEAKGMMARQAWLNTPVKVSPLAFLSRGFGNLADGVEALKRGEPGAAERMADYYRSENAHAAAAARLTLEESAWALGMTREDGKQTSNEAALLAELQRVEQAQAAPAR